MEDFDRLKAQKEKYELAIVLLRDERDQERRWKEAAQRESEKLALYISELKTQLAICRETIKEFQK